MEPVGRFLRRLLPVLVLIFTVGGLFVYVRYWDQAPAPQTAQQQAPPPEVAVTVVEPGRAPLTTEFLGRTEAAQVIEIRSRVAGYLQERFFTEGELVEPGQPLFQIDPRPFEVALAEARARLASSEARLARARQALRQVEEAYELNASSQTELNEAQTEAEVAASEVELARAQVAAAELQLEYASIESPIQGRIGRAMQDVGSYVDSGSGGLLAVVRQIDPMYVYYSVTETEILRFERQFAAKEIEVPEIETIELQVTLADGSVYPYRGRINFVDVQIDLTTGTTVIRGEAPNPDGVLRPGQLVQARPLGIERLGVISVPRRAVMRAPTGATVYVVGADNIVEARPVTLGEWSGQDRWIIEAGLAPGDRVIVDHLTAVRPGMEVQPQPATELETEPEPAPPPGAAGAPGSPQPAAGDEGP